MGLLSNMDEIMEDLTNCKDLFKITQNDYLYNYYVETKQDLKKADILPITKKQISMIFVNSKFKEKFIQMIKNIQTKRLYKSNMHGINHNIRVAIFVYILANFEDVSIREFEMLIDCAKYHDIGRTDDCMDYKHGLKSASKLNFLTDYNQEELNLMKTIITCHSMEDNEIDKYIQIYKVKDINKCKKLFNILKDADGLDRVRLPYPKVHIDLLRTGTAKRIVLFAFEMYIYLQKFI